MMERVALTLQEKSDSPYHIRALYKVGSYEEVIPSKTGQMAGGCVIVRVGTKLRGNRLMMKP